MNTFLVFACLVIIYGAAAYVVDTGSNDGDVVSRMGSAVEMAPELKMEQSRQVMDDVAAASDLVASRMGSAVQMQSALVDSRMGSDVALQKELVASRMGSAVDMQKELEKVLLQGDKEVVSTETKDG